MKKLFLLLVLMILFAACSVDNEDTVIFEEDAVAMTSFNPAAQRIGTATKTPGCIQSLSGSTYVDVSEGFTSPKVVFVADVPSDGTQVNFYTLHLEIQLLTDCEDLASGAGAITRYSLYNIPMPSLSDPKISLAQSQLPSSCYRWRWVVGGGSLTTPCITTTFWYYEPLF